MSDPFFNYEYEKYDGEGLINQIENFALEWQEAETVSSLARVPDDYRGITKIVLLGMGGSGIANESIKELMFDSPIVVEAIHDYAVPGFVDESTLIVASSYSGNTEEPITAFKMAREKGAKLFAITTGGQLLEYCKENAIPYHTFTYPSQPRMAFAYLFFPVLTILNQLGIMTKEALGTIDYEIVKRIGDTYRRDNATEVNPAKQAAMKLKDKFPIIYSTTITHSYGVRFKNQICENAKSFSLSETFPELNHNSTEGYRFPRLPLHILSLVSKWDNERVLLREQITGEILDKENISHETIRFDEAPNRTTELLLFAHYADAVSYYLAMLNQVVPAEIPNINYLKSKL